MAGWGWPAFFFVVPPRGGVVPGFIPRGCTVYSTAVWQEPLSAVAVKPPRIDESEVVITHKTLNIRLEEVKTTGA